MNTTKGITLDEIVDGEDFYLFYDDVTWNTALHLASSQGNLSLVASIVLSGFPADLQNAAGQSALHLATLAQHYAVCQFLIKAGANALLNDNDDTSPLDTAISLDNFKLMDLFLKTKPQIKNPYVLLARALADYRENMIQAFNQNGFPLRTESGPNLFFYMAICSDDVRIFRRLVEEGLDVNARDERGTVLHIVAQHCPNPEVMRLLIDSGADPDALDTTKYKGSPLFAAISGNHVLNVGVLLEYGVDISLNVWPKR